ncbi:hypothetical protein MVEN_02193100 [Mycena venus]|uniref:Uncharacterized protein n=1 Tax=Mycena venus TaxID=2733690 RepID=A0A8H6X7G9_9AGAR|nr:hypothetical protein MVEN_02193100 [Mycena venus]
MTFDLLTMSTYLLLSELGALWISLSRNLRWTACPPPRWLRSATDGYRVFKWLTDPLAQKRTLRLASLNSNLLLLAGTMIFFLQFFPSWTLCFILFLSFLVDGHVVSRNAIGPAEIALPPLSSNLHPQATGYAFDLENALPPASNTQLQIQVPPNCAQYVGGNDSECPSSMSATAVTYEDCGDAFTVCRCDNANMTLDTAVDRLGRVPVGLRRFVGTIFILSDATRAYTNLSTGDIHLFGDCAMDVWIHEASHAFDFASPSSLHSNSTDWQLAIANDSCVPDPYSLTNRVEDFAQMSVMKIYKLLHDGHLPPGFEENCMFNQLAFMDTLLLYNATSLFGNTCAINDSSLGVRHNKPPAVLDAGRVFMTVPLDPTPSLSASGTAATHNSASGLRHRESLLWMALNILFLFLNFGI